MTSREVIHKLSARSEFLPFTEFADKLHILLVGDGEAAGAAACRPHHFLWYILSLLILCSCTDSASVKLSGIIMLVNIVEEK